MAKVTLKTLQDLKSKQQKIAMLTTYDASFAKVLNDQHVDVILIGDTLGNIVQGHASTLPVTISDMVYHTHCVARGNKHALLMSDMPFMTYATLDAALNNAMQLMQAGADLIKMEGGAHLCDFVTTLKNNGIPVCGHLGLQPQSINVLGGYQVQGKNETAAQTILKDALALQAAGISLLILECVPSQLAKEITQQLKIPVVGIGAGVDCDGQVLVLHDMLGLNEGSQLKFVKNFMQGQDSIQAAIAAYVQAVKSSEFPSREHEFR